MTDDEFLIAEAAACMWEEVCALRTMDTVLLTRK